MSKKLLLISILFSNILLFGDTEEGQELFVEAECMACHNKEDFAKREKKVHNFKKLHKAVNACRFANEAEWFDDECLEVSKYLNEKYYRFKDVPKE